MFLSFLYNLLRFLCVQNLINGARKGRSLICNKERLGAPGSDSLDGYLNQFEGKLECLRSYLAAAGANRGSAFGASFSDFKYLAGNLGINRFFSSKAPKKKSEKQSFFQIDSL